MDLHAKIMPAADTAGSIHPLSLPRYHGLCDFILLSSWYRGLFSVSAVVAYCLLRPSLPVRPHSVVIDLEPYHPP